MQHLLEVKNVAELLGVSERRVRAIIISGKLPAETAPSRGGKGGQKYLVPVSALPPSAQEEYFRQSGTTLPVPSSPAPSIMPPRTVASASDALPEWAEKTALARADLVHNWRKAKARAKDGGHKVADALETFLAAYNSGQLFPAIYAALENVSQGTLYRWEKAYADAGDDYHALAPEWGDWSRPVMERNKSKLLPEVASYFLGGLLQDNKLSVSTAIKYTRHHFRLAEGNMVLPCDKTFERYVGTFKDQYHHIWTLAREGEKSLKDTDLPYIVRDWDRIEVGDMAVADGHRLNFRVVHPFTGRPCRASMVMYYDAKSRFPIGWEIMPEENVQAVSAAFRMAVLTLGKVPRVSYLDNGKAFKAKVFTSKVNLEEQGFLGMYARLGCIAIFAAPYNARAKIIERFFGTFNEWFERIMPSYSGQSIEDRPARYKRNEKLMQLVHKDYVPTIEEAMQLIARWLDEFYVHEPHGGLGGRTPAEVFEAGKGPGVNEAELDFLLMNMKVSRIERNGIKFEGGYYWHEALVGWREPVMVRYSFNNYRKVLIHTLRGEFLCWAERKEECHPLANVMGGIEDRAQLKEVQTRHKQIEKDTKKLYRQVIDADSLKLPYGKLVELTPKLGEQLEAIDAERAASKETLTDRLIRGGASSPPCLPADTAGVEDVTASDGEPLYYSDYDKWAALKAKKILTDDERRWFDQHEGRLAAYA